ATRAGLLIREIADLVRALGFDDRQALRAARRSVTIAIGSPGRRRPNVWKNLFQSNAAQLRSRYRRDRSTSCDFEHPSARRTRQE
ncbi:MAG: hypothetical protein KGI64_10995, partial [Xanthomonadaceae bacterium]|nr:hypothetical protein [Xanthomonadaceae bacterium]